MEDRSSEARLVQWESMVSSGPRVLPNDATRLCAPYEQSAVIEV